MNFSCLQYRVVRLSIGLEVFSGVKGRYANYLNQPRSPRIISTTGRTISGCEIHPFVNLARNSQPESRSGIRSRIRFQATSAWSSHQDMRKPANVAGFLHTPNRLSACLLWHSAPNLWHIRDFLAALQESLVSAAALFYYHRMPNVSGMISVDTLWKWAW